MVAVPKIIHVLFFIKLPTNLIVILEWTNLVTKSYKAKAPLFENKKLAIKANQLELNVKYCSFNNIIQETANIFQLGHML